MGPETFWALTCFYWQEVVCCQQLSGPLGKKERAAGLWSRGAAVSHVVRVEPAALTD